MARSRCRRASLALCCCAAVLAGAGCVERRYTIRTNPPGAIVVVNGEEIGPTPVSRSFVYYGPRKITLIADGYETQQIIQPVKEPWWDSGLLLTDFVSENLVPFTLRDEREFAYTLAPKVIPETNDLINRSEQYRVQGRTPPAPRRRWFFGLFGGD